ncbi:hypothetical protein LRH25_01575 [Ideonella azotifigens]|uniref:Lipoprotein n=1 Tax=Ideonella azotifigens TaxID=513160 RepID=A0ABN1K9L4_9BURK|nr:hypothetical protein [Ideonella azotifigens]MCD2339024.1 hypothetical protein [Ideonella azotifigens]
MRRILVSTLVLASLLAGCDQLGIESATVVAEKKSAEGKAIGAACRHAGRAIEDCYTLNKKAEKASIYAGWREMDDYMRENKIEPVVPVIKPEEKKPKPPEGDDAADDSKPAASEAGKDGKDAKPAKDAKKPAH